MPFSFRKLLSAFQVQSYALMRETVGAAWQFLMHQCVTLNNFTSTGLVVSQRL